MTAQKPHQKPESPYFSSGPCRKWPGFSADALSGALLGRSHRSGDGRARLKLAIERTRSVLDLPSDYRVAIVPASDTGAIEMCLWSLLGPRAVTVLAFESFGRLWLQDIAEELALPNVRAMVADYGDIPDLSDIDFANDVVFTANGTTSGVRVPDYEWIAADRTGLTIADGSSAVFCHAIDWAKLDVTTFSWQKGLGGEAQHGMVILSPRAVERLISVKPPRPMPKLFRMTRGGVLNEALFEGETINTPSMLAVEDFLGALHWAEREGGVAGLIQRTQTNAEIVYRWIERTDWAEPLCRVAACRSTTPVCLSFAAPEVQALPVAQKFALRDRITDLLEAEGVAYDIGSYRDAPPGLRIWTGPTVGPEDVALLTHWLDWAYCAAMAEG